MGSGEERPRHRLVETAAGQAPAGEQRAPLQRGENRPRHSVRPRHGSGGHLVQTDDAAHLLDEIGFAADIGPPARNGAGKAACPFGHAEAEGRQDALLLGPGHVDAAQGLHARLAQGEAAARLRNFPRHDGLRRLAAAQIEDHGGGDLDAVGHEGRIDAALEAVAGIGLDLQLASGGGGAQRIEERRLEEHVDRLGRAARLHAAHDAGDADGAIAVGDHRHARVEGICAAVERLDGLAVLRHAGLDGARELSASKTCSGRS